MKQTRSLSEFSYMSEYTRLYPSEARVYSVWSETSPVAVYEDARSYSSGPSLIA